MTPLRLMHLANHGSRNIGNAALILGLERVLREDLPRELEFAPEPWDAYSRGERRFDERFVERVNEEADALLVGAAVSFDGSGIYANTGFRFDLPLDLWNRIERPLVFYGLSYRAWSRRPYQHRDALRRALEQVDASDRILFGVRNDGTKRWLEGVLGRPSERVAVVPDPAVYVPVQDAPHPELDPSRANVVVAPNAEDEIPRWGRALRKRALRRPSTGGLRELLPLTTSWGWQESRARFVRSFARALGRLSQERDLQLVFAAHDVADVRMASELVALLPDDVQRRVAFAPSGLTVDRGPVFYDLYAKADAAIGMRIHSMNPVIGIGTPVVPLVSQGRMSAFMADAGLSELCVDVHGEVEESLVAAAGRALDEPGQARGILREAHDRLRERTRAFNGRVARFLEAG